MTQKAPFKPERFDNVVSEYLDFRVRYDPKLITWLAKDTGVDKSERVLDLGCGPGFIANAIAEFAKEVIGADPSPAMIAAANASAAPNTQFVLGSSLDLSFLDPGIQLVTMGRSFHWMDRDATLTAFDGIIAQGGAIALLGDRVVDEPGSAWWRTANDVARAYAVGDDYDLFRRSKEWSPHDVPLNASAFSALTEISTFQQQSWDFDQFVGLTMSRSGTTPEKLGDRRHAFETELKSALAPYGPGPWSALHQHYALIARRQG